MDDFRVKKASEILSKFFDETTLQAATQFDTFRSTWRQIVGPRLADHSKPKGILHHALLICADHAGWVQLLQLNQERILARISKHYPELEITGLAFTVEEQEDALVSRKESSSGPAKESSIAAEEEKSDAEKSAGDGISESEAKKGELATSVYIPSCTKKEDQLPEPLKEIFLRMKKASANPTHCKGN